MEENKVVENPTVEDTSKSTWKEKIQQKQEI